jgi:hypothetical protein
MGLKATNLEVLRILLSIGPSETQTWQDKAGNAPPLTDATNGLTFPDLTKESAGQLFLNNLIMPEPCPFKAFLHFERVDESRWTGQASPRLLEAGFC